MYWSTVWKLWVLGSVLMFFASWIAEGFPLERDEEDSTGEYVSIVIFGFLFFIFLWPVVLWWFITKPQLREALKENTLGLLKKSRGKE